MRSSKYISTVGATARSAGTEPYPVAGTAAESAEEDALETTGEGEEMLEGAITGTEMAGVDTREVVEGVEMVTTGAVVGRVVGEVTAVAAARLEA